MIESVTLRNWRTILYGKIIVNGGHNRLVEPSKSKEQKCCPSLLAATVLASEGGTNLENVPVLSDVPTMNVVRGLNAQVTFNEEDNTVVVDARKIIRGSTYM